MSKAKSITLVLGILIMSFLLGYLVIAWTEPTEAPPGGNVPAPLNVSINAQSKEGALVIGTNSGLTTGLIVRYGNVGIGTTTPQTKLDVAGAIKIGSQATCNANMEGVLRYNSTSKVSEICDGTSWIAGGTGDMLKSVYDPDNNGIVREIPYRLAASETTLKDAGGTGWYCGQTEYLLMKSITVPKNYIVAGSIRVKFQIQQSTVDNTACGKVYKNDVPIGTEFCTGQGIAGTSQDFSNIKAGDKIQLWGKTTSGGCIMVHHFRTAGDSVLIPPSW